MVGIKKDRVGHVDKNLINLSVKKT